MADENNKALWIFKNFKEAIDVIPKKYRGRAWEILINYAFGEVEEINKENLYIQMAVKSLIPLIKLRGKGGSQSGVSNNPTGKSKPKAEANVGAKVGVNVGATPLITETITETITQTGTITETITETETGGGEFACPKIDPLTSPLVEQVFNTYKLICPDLVALGRFYKRDVKLRKRVAEYLEQTECDLGYFEGVCKKANNIKKIADANIDLKMILNNHDGIANGKYLCENETKNENIGGLF